MSDKKLVTKIICDEKLYFGMGGCFERGCFERGVHVRAELRGMLVHAISIATACYTNLT